MFETPQEQVPDSKVGIWIGVAIIAVVAIALFVYVSRKPNRSAPGGALSAASVGAVPAGASAAGADPAKDLRFVDVKMAKDYTGTTAQWLVDMRNESPTYTYSNIGYETTYIDANSNVLLVNHGKMNLTLGPGEDQSTQIRDALYPDGTATYRIRVTGASSSR